MRPGNATAMEDSGLHLVCYPTEMGGRETGRDEIGDLFFGDRIMAEWRIEVVTADKKQKKVFVVGADGLGQAKQRALREFRALMPEKKNLFLESKKSGTYVVVSDLYDVGEVSLKRTS